MDARFLPQGPCFFCAAVSPAYICGDCRHELFIAERARCPVCALPAQEARICGGCLLNPPLFETTTVLTDYCYPFDRYIQTLKFQHRPELISLPATRLADEIIRQGGLPEAIIPVPLHGSRQRQRGYNQALLIARALGRRLGVSVIDNAVIRCRATASQSGLKHRDRLGNVRKAFKLSRPLAVTRVAVCDDVVTTGATVNELAKLLIANGCSEVQVWALARTPG